MTLATLWLTLAVLLPAVASLVAPMSAVDLAYQLRAGDLVLGGAGIPRTDTFTFSVAGQPWLDQQWAAQVLLAGVHDLGGWVLLAILRALLVAVVAGGVLVGCRAAGLGPRPAAGLTLLSFLVAAPAMALRPQLLGMACFAIVLALLALRERRPGSVWLVVPIALVWANVHGSFPLAPAAIAVALLTDLVAGRRAALRQLGPVLVATLVATVVTPWGPGVWRYVVDLAADPNLRTLVTEWQPPSPLSFVGIALIATAIGASAVIVATLRRGVPIGRIWPTVGWLVGLAALAVSAERGIAWWAIGAPVAVAGLLAAPASSAETPAPAAAPPRPVPSSPLGIAIVALVAVAGGLLVVPWLGSDPVDGPADRLTDAPAGLTTAVRAAGPGVRLFAAQRWGSWLEWAVPEDTVLVDSRIELFPSAVWDDHLAVSAGDPGWQAILDRWGVELIVASPTEQAGLLAALATDSGWTRIAADDEGAVYARTTAEDGAGTDRSAGRLPSGSAPAAS